MTVYPHTTAIEARLAPGIADCVRTSLAIEAADLRDERSYTTIDERDGTIVIAVKSRDVTSLRAACTTWLGLLRTAEAVHAIAEPGC